MFLKILQKSQNSIVQDSGFNEVEGLQPAALLQKKPRRTYFSVNFMEFLGTPFLLNSSGLLLQTLHVHKVEENVSRYCNKEIKVILIEAILVTVCHL